ncbi:uncharacterized protein Z519_12427 [Cladophialophora bantiana CBS 173.52]|uniref:Uncharacterized protein n=1 Tax=Cladophialophora bantiana (strain ATCC 10958 / CBS 173.52 / CDC B-1940 / NIH 8579) TaxID=1442370 RepID=A0A0D2FJT8_CLAB1|nr:uncharacterized protein Z519_12427 [Cladophialophora bantiana CBS 173.52]KIW86962.1 hypothetical protein Z519_12427 [Cladophialophora bantiana CBS 173.52]
MDLFHTVTQAIDQVLTCDWYESFKSFKMEGNKAQDKTIDTAPGGETPQYESIQTETVATSKQRGQLGAGSNTSEIPSLSEDRGQQTADNIICGQNISESGMGGKTASQGGNAGQQGGYGGTSDQAEGQKDTRPQQRYEGGTGIGA